MDNNIDLDDMLQAFNEIQMPRTAYQLQHFVVGAQDSIASSYAHCVLELSNNWDNLRISKYKERILQLEIDKLLATDDEISHLEADIKKIELEQYGRAILGAKREFDVLYKMWGMYPHKYTREELEDDQHEYWSKRLTRQAEQDVLSTGRIGQGNLEALKNIGLGTVPQLDVIRETEQKYLAMGDQKILIAVPTEYKDEKLKCLEGITIPSNAQVKIFNVFGRKVADAYTTAVIEAINDNANWLITIEDDMSLQPDTLIKLFDVAKNNPVCAIGAWYPKRSHPRQGVHIHIGDNNMREYLDDDGKVHEVYTLAMGCTIYPVSMFVKISQPWFVTTEKMTQDSFFSQRARDAGYKLLVDTDIKCKHIDRVSGEVYE